MQRGTRTLVAVGVLLAGLTTALMFRHTPSVAPAPRTSESELLRKASSPTLPSLPSLPSEPVERPAARIEPPTATVAKPTSQSPAILLPLDAGQAPPELAKTYPGGGLSATNPLAERAGIARTHKIVDGDTLAALAERYLGRADRAGEILEVNREVLTCPELLPIGAVLRIPPRQTAP